MESSTTPTRTADRTAPAYEQCENCGSPVDAAQRYCVVCGNKRRHVTDPAAQYLAKAKAASRTRTTQATRSRGTSRRANRAFSLGTAIVLAIIPIAIGLGVLIGRASNNGDDKLIAALKTQKPQIIQTGGGGGGSDNSGSSSSSAQSSSSNTPVAALSSDYPLSSGYAVELQTLPGHGTTTVTVSKAKSAAAKKGATKVGLIVQSDFKVTPAPPSGTYVLYSGAYKTSADAQSALAKLKSKFPSAVVIKVQSTSAVAGAGRALTKTQYGTAHQIAGFKPTQSQVTQGQQAVNKIQSQQGKNYVNQQRGLPDVIVVK